MPNPAYSGTIYFSRIPRYYKRLDTKLIVSAKVHYYLLEIESIVLKARSTILGILGISNFRHLLNQALRTITHLELLCTFVKGANKKTGRQSRLSAIVQRYVRRWRMNNFHLIFGLMVTL
jgi:hypothetical protein